MKARDWTTTLPLFGLLLLTLVLPFDQLFGAYADDAGISCPFNANNTNYFPEYAQPATLNNCNQFSSASCCDPTYDALISGSRDYIGKSFKKYITNPSAECEQIIKGAQCLLCSPAQSTFFGVHSYGNSIKLCESYCTSLYENCKLSKLVNKQNTTIEQEFKHSTNPGDDLCYAIFHPLWNVDVSATNCEIDQPCTADDYVGVYTPCHYGFRSAVYYIKEGVKCTGGVPLPSTKTNLPCDKSCGPGQALLIGDTECVTCSPGSFSIGGGNTYEDWSTKPRDFVTYCTQLDPQLREPVLIEECGWEWNNTITSTGYHWDDSNINVTLELGVSFVRSVGSYIKFLAKVSAADRDVLLFLIDDKQVFSTSRTAGYEEFSFEIDPGYHILRWIYSKDAVVSMGEDQAHIEWIKIAGSKLADEACSLCEPGTYQSHSDASECYACPAGTFSSSYGATECSNCPDNTYSWRGSTECLPREPCSETDLISFYSDCGSSGRTLTYAIADPVICDTNGFVPPPTSTVACAPCPIGEHRVGSICEGCPKGSFWNGDSCTACAAGSEAPAYKFYSNFDATWKNDFSTKCYGPLCATDGWKLNGTKLDSGVLHGANIVSNIVLPPVSMKAGDKVNYDLTIYCTQETTGNLHLFPCSLEFSAFDFSHNIPFVYQATYNTTKDVTHIVMEWNSTLDGNYELHWSFRKRSSVDTRNYDRAVLNALIVQTDDGSASSCNLCPAGTSTNGKSQETRCNECPPGTYSSQGAEQCLPCDDGTYSNTYSASSCQPCGTGTSSNAAKTGCVDPCRAVFGDVEYDLSKLKKDEMYGPIYDQNHEKYYIDVCKIPETTYSCVDGQGNPVHAYVCQITNQKTPIGLNLGTFVSYSQNERGDVRSGLTVNYTGGSGGCRGQYRSTTLHLTCDPEAGVGTPEPFEPVENPGCHYSFLWPSTYACPLCTSRDYTYDQSDCIDGQATQVYRWLYPKRCHDGVELPEPTTATCVTESIVCGEGHYYDNVQQSCEVCPAGYYCVDGGILYDDWTSLPAGFNVTGHWDTAARYLFSQGGSLSKTVNFQRPGRITTVYNAYLDDARLIFTVDSTLHPLPAGSTDFETITYSIPVDLGTHKLSWTLVPGTSRSDYGYGLIIHNITLIGLSPSITKPVPCPAGFSSSEGQSSCDSCPANSASVSTGPCTPCDTNFYSLPGYPQCNPLPTCTDDDWQKLYTECSQSKRQAVYVKLNLCRSDIAGSSKINGTKSNCPACPKGLLRKDEFGNSTDDCRSCPTGYYVQDGSCVAVPKGSVAPLDRVLWAQEDQASISLPAGFATGCDGISCISNGWRTRDSSMDSGTQEVGFADSWLHYDLNLVTDGWISFQYKTEEDGEHSGLQFYIDGALQNNIIFGSSGTRSSGQIPLTKGNHKLLWNYHHQNEKQVQGIASVWNVNIRGDSYGGASEVQQCKKGTYASKQTQCVPCSPGSYSDAEGKTSCTLCPKGLFSDEAGATQCTKCPKGTYSDSTGAVFCSSSCSFNSNGRTYDLAPLNEVQTVLASGHFLLMSICNRLPTDLSDPQGAKTDSFIVDLQTQQNLGKYMTQADPPAGANLQLTFTGPKSGECDEVTTDIVFYCEMPNETNTIYGYHSGPVLTRTAKCNNKFAWRSFFACPLCRNYDDFDDYTAQTTECEKNSQNVSYIRAASCFGPAIVGAHTEPCSTKVAFPMYVLISLAVVFIALAIIAVVFYINYRSLNSRYSLLVEEKSKNLEMNELASSQSNQSDENAP